MKAIITEAEFLGKIPEKRAVYQKLLNPNAAKTIGEQIDIGLASCAAFRRAALGDRRIGRRESHPEELRTAAGGGGACDQ